MKYQKLLKQAREQNYGLGICASIFIQNKVLLLQRSTQDNYAGIWEMPGGGVENNENLIEATIREVFEETNIVVNLKDLVFIDYFDFHNIEKKIHNRKFCFQVIIDKEPLIKISDEHQNVKLFEKKDILALVSSHQNEKDYQIWDSHYQLALKNF